MNANILFAGLAAVAVASPAFAQQLPRAPESAFGTLRAMAPTPKPPASPVVPVLVTELDDRPPAFNSEAAKSFAGRVQPVLANACANCHARKDHASRFRMRYTSGEYVDHDATNANLYAVVRMLDREKPADSLILAKALTAHGGAKDAPLRSVAAFRGLEAWVHWAAATEGAAIPTKFPALPVAAIVPTPSASPPSLAQLTGGKKPAHTIEEPPPAPGAPTHLVLGPREPGKLPPLPKAEPITPGGFATGPRAPTADPTKPNPADEFDPAAFNRAMHPNRK